MSQSQQPHASTSTSTSQNEQQMDHDQTSTITESEPTQASSVLLPAETPLASTPTGALPAPPAPPTVPRTFLAALELASLGPKATAFVEPPPYVPTPTSTVATGVVRKEAGTRIVPDEEMKVGGSSMGAGANGAGGKKWMREEEVKKLGVAELKKMGLGRGPTGECGCLGLRKSEREGGS